MPPNHTPQMRLLFTAMPEEPILHQVNFRVYDTIFKYEVHATLVAFAPVLKEGSRAKNPENW
jgi:hypothetical protein